MSQTVPLSTMVVRLTLDAQKYLSGMNNVFGNQAFAGIMRAWTVGVTRPILALSAAAVKEFATFNQAMTESLSIMQRVTPQMKEQLESVAIQFSKETITSASDLAKSYYYLTQSGLTAAESLAALDTVNRFAIAGMFDQKKATDLLTDAQAALGKNVKNNAAANAAEMTRIGDILVKASTVANSSVEQFSKALTAKAGAAMKLFNRSTEEGVAVLSAFADQGIRAELAGNMYDRALRLLAKSAMSNAAEHRALKFSVFDANGAMRNMADISDNLTQIMAGLSDEQKAATLLMLGFEARSQQAITPLIGMGDAIRGWESDLRKAGGSIQEVSDIIQTSFNAQLEIMWNQIKSVMISLGEPFSESMKGVTELVRYLVDQFHSIDRATQGWLTSIAKLIAYMAPFVTLVGLLGWTALRALGHILLFVGGIQSAIVQMVAMRLVVIGVAGVITGVLVTGVVMATRYLIGFNAELDKSAKAYEQFKKFKGKEQNSEIEAIRQMPAGPERDALLGKALVMAKDRMINEGTYSQQRQNDVTNFKNEQGWLDAPGNWLTGNAKEKLLQQEADEAKGRYTIASDHFKALQQLQTELVQMDKDKAGAAAKMKENQEKVGVINSMRELGIIFSGGKNGDDSQIRGADMMEKLEEWKNGVGRSTPLMKTMVSAATDIQKSMTGGAKSFWDFLQRSNKEMKKLAENHEKYEESVERIMQEKEKEREEFIRNYNESKTNGIDAGSGGGGVNSGPLGAGLMKDILGDRFVSTFAANGKLMPGMGNAQFQQDMEKAAREEAERKSLEELTKQSTLLETLVDRFETQNDIMRAGSVATKAVNVLGALF